LEKFMKLKFPLIVMFLSLSAGAAFGQQLKTPYTCVTVTDGPDNFHSYTITNDCGVDVQYWYGSWNRDDDSGYISYSGTLYAGRQTRTGVMSNIALLACDRNYKLTYRYANGNGATGATVGLAE
jgi:hypothetical protein